jgi:hypothetical protein
MVPIPIVFVHLGPAIPPYWKDAVQQARRWNPDSPIICISEKAHAFDASEQWVELSTLPDSPAYARFKQRNYLDSSFRDGFWRYTTERLFVLESWMEWTGVSEFFHLENDNTLYLNLEEYKSQFHFYSPGLLVPFVGQGEARDTPHICFSVMYCNSLKAITEFLQSLASSLSIQNEMIRGGEYWMLNPESCGCLPSAPPGAVLLDETYKEWLIQPSCPILFDGAAHGQYMGGQDPRNEGFKDSGYINLYTDFRADQFVYAWKVDEAGRRYPVLLDSDGRPWRLANLHIHCKRIHEFCS